MDLTSIITVAGVWILIFFLTLSYFLLFVPTLYKQNQLVFYIIAPLCSITIIIGCISYFRAIYASPGYPQKELKNMYQDELDEMKSRAEQEKQFKRLRKEKKLVRQIEKRQIQNLVQDSYCDKCDNVKLSRVHHCKICRRCIQRMDHHCPWVGNCIGKHNHKYFLLFLFYVSVSLLVVSISIIADYISGEVVLYQIFEQNQIYYYIILMVGVMCLLLLFSIGFLCVTQCMMLMQNLTTLQTFYEGIHLYNPFDKNSIFEHIKQINGNSILLLPTNPFPDHQQQINIALQC